MATNTQETLKLLLVLIYQPCWAFRALLCCVVKFLWGWNVQTNSSKHEFLDSELALCTLTDWCWSSGVVLRNSLVLTSCLIVHYFAGIWSLRASKSGGAARVRGLQRTRGRLWRRSRRCAWSQCKCWSKCPPGCSTGRSPRYWSPRWPGRAAAGSGTSLRPPHLQVRQTVRCCCRTHGYVSLFYVTDELPCSMPSSGSLKRTLRLELCLESLMLGGGKPSRDALLLFRMETRPSGEELWRRNQS